MRTPVTAIFDIGKTNKKFFLFDENFKEVYRDYSSFDLIEDEDAFPTDDLPAIEQWIKSTFKKILASKKYDVKAINFSTYGASFVHVDQQGKLLTPLYNYTKPYPENLLASFYEKYGDEHLIAQDTCSPPLGMLNSGLQLYWLKYERPEVYKKIQYSFHFPQYLSFLFTGIPLSEFTSIGCHTRLWDFKKNDYHKWIYEEGIDEKLPPVVKADTAIESNFNGKRIKIGVGIHDSSSALLPYLKSDAEPFLLVSTGTWSICLNPFSREQPLMTDPDNDCLNYMQIDGKPVMATRLFLGNEYQLQLDKLCSHFDKAAGYDRGISFDENLYQKLINDFTFKFHFESLPKREKQPQETDLTSFRTFEEAYHHLMIELIQLQVKNIKSCIGATEVNKIYIDGGFTDNDVFVKLLTLYLQDMKIRTTKSPLGSALGASIVISDFNKGATFLKENYALQKHEPLILS